MQATKTMANQQSLHSHMDGWREDAQLNLWCCHNKALSVCYNRTRDKTRLIFLQQQLSCRPWTGTRKTSNRGLTAWQGDECWLSCVWSPSSVGLIRKIEAVQKRFTKRLPGLNFLDYHERLALLGLESLELRQLKADLCLTYKIMFNLVDLNVDNFFAVRTNKITRCHQYTLVKSLCKVRARNNFIACRVVDPWNYLDAKSNSFKSLNALQKNSRCMWFIELLCL